MARYVVITGHPQYMREGSLFTSARHAVPARHTDPGQELLGMLDGWARQIDFLDHRESPLTMGGPLPTPSPAETYMHYVVPCPVPSMSDRSEDHRRDQVHRFTLAGYRDAARWAGRGGELGIVFNHSSPLSLHLAPGGWLQIYRQTLERIHRSREREAEGGGDGDRELSLGDLVVSRIGDVLYGGPDQPARRPAVGSRTTPFIRRVNLLSCSVGVGEIGQAFLDWLQVVWGVPVRGLRGTLTLTQAGVDPIRSFVAPADSLNLSRAEREEFLEPRLNDPHMHPALWATSRDVVPTSTP